jgi:flagellar biosynthesis chaperone FliJ
METMQNKCIRWAIDETLKGDFNEAIKFLLWAKEEKQNDNNELKKAQEELKKAQEKIKELSEQNNNLLINLEILE